jgi:hypothetical protein
VYLPQMLQRGLPRLRNLGLNDISCAKFPIKLTGDERLRDLDKKVVAERHFDDDLPQDSAEATVAKYMSKPRRQRYSIDTSIAATTVDDGSSQDSGDDVLRWHTPLIASVGDGAASAEEGDDVIGKAAVPARVFV